MAYITFLLGVMLWTVSNAQTDCTVEVFEGRYFCVHKRQPRDNYEDAMSRCSKKFAQLPSQNDILIDDMDYIKQFLWNKLKRSYYRVAWLSDPVISSHQDQRCAAVTFYRWNFKVHFSFTNKPCTPLYKPHTICLCYDNCTMLISEPGGSATEPLYLDTEPVGEPVSGPVDALTWWTDVFNPMLSEMPDFHPTRAPIIMNETDFDIFDEDTTAISERTSTSDRDIAPFNDRQISEKGPQIGAIAGGVTVAVLVVIAIIVIFLIIYKRRSKKDDYQDPANKAQTSTPGGIDNAIYFSNNEIIPSKDGFNQNRPTSDLEVVENELYQ